MVLTVREAKCTDAMGKDPPSSPSSLHILPSSLPPFDDHPSPLDPPPHPHAACPLSLHHSPLHLFMIPCSLFSMLSCTSMFFALSLRVIVNTVTPMCIVFTISHQHVFRNVNTKAGRVASSGNVPSACIILWWTSRVFLLRFAWHLAATSCILGHRHPS